MIRDRFAGFRHLQLLHDIYLAEQTPERLWRGDEQTFRLNEVERDLGLAD